MNRVTNDEQFQTALMRLTPTQQRVLAARFTEHVAKWSKDQRISAILSVALDEHASQEDLQAALQSAKAATFDSHARCGSEADWREQAAYFVARAAVAALNCANTTMNSCAWQAAMSARMVVTCVCISTEKTPMEPEERLEQYRILDQFLSRAIET